jgi:CRISPR-associated protein Cmr2
VYAGGDDLLAFVPARTALPAAQECHAVISSPELPTASTAVLFFHYHEGLQGVLSRARLLLHEAKERVDGKHALAVGYLRRSGISQVSIQKWAVRGHQDTADLFGVFASDVKHRLSPGLLADLDRDKKELAALSEADPEIYRAELIRLVRRHTANANNGEGTGAVADAAVRAADALAWLGRWEKAGPLDSGERSRPEYAARVGVFLRQEAR